MKSLNTNICIYILLKAARIKRVKLIRGPQSNHVGCYVKEAMLDVYLKGD